MRSPRRSTPRWRAGARRTARRTPSRPTASSRSREIALDTAQALRAGGPWGQAFPEPTFDGVFELRDARVIGERHLKMWVEVPRSGRSFDAIAFNHLEEGAAASRRPSAPAHLVYRLDVNEYQGERRLQLLVDHLAAGGSLRRGAAGDSIRSRYGSQSAQAPAQRSRGAHRLLTGVSLSTTASRNASRK